MTYNRSPSTSSFSSTRTQPFININRTQSQPQPLTSQASTYQPPRPLPVPLPLPSHPSSDQLHSHHSIRSQSTPEESHEDYQLKLALLASRDEHERHQLTLEQRELEMVERARRESETAEAERKQNEKVRLASLEESEREILEGVLLESQSHYQQNSVNDEDQLALELALAMSLSEAEASGPLWSFASAASTFENGDHSSSLSTDLQHTQSTHISHQINGPNPSISTIEPNYTTHHAHSPLSAREQYQNSHLQTPLLASNLTGHSAADHPPPYIVVASPTSATDFPPLSNYFSSPSTAHQAHETPQAGLIGRQPSRPPLPPRRPNLEGRLSGSLNVLHQRASLAGFPSDESSELVDEERSRPASSLGLSRPDDLAAANMESDPFVDRFAATTPFEEEANPLQRPALMIRTRSDQFVPFPVASSHSDRASLSTLQFPDETEAVDEAIKEALERARSQSVYSGSFAPMAVDDEDSDVFGTLEEPECSPPSSPTSLSDSRTFTANPRPSPSMCEGVRYGSMEENRASLEFEGQFPDSIGLSKYGRDGGPANGLFGIEAWSWNQLLTYFMWHGNSRLEAGPLDVAEAEENNTPTKLALFVEFVYRPTLPNAQTYVKLVLELISGPEPALPQYAKQKSTISHHSRHSLSTLASSLHEIHTVARLVSCSSSPFRTAKPGLNTDRLKRLAKAIEREQVGQKGKGIVEEERLIKRGKRWLRRKMATSAGGNESERVDGEGLPLPNGATLVQPWDSEWS
ncbi:hypothetical protein CROQUDRAFT_259087 [Cronartium quercuum f. sp. fusiforme G11]|uniref:Uncharacterized protein n=1 Tax=Cronartium quercuum f. sp. fusiforme G11 TaxID=708437 RepID=A0A9P6N9R4_9BASI|nr:hypothetical protein CROQUDRAFT_259087 [Cronartium quercuum f. sp. fusiforme G11]